MDEVASNWREPLLKTLPPSPDVELLPFKSFLLATLSVGTI